MNATTILLTQVEDEGVKGRAMFRLIRDRSGVTAIEYA
jgi:Flp pilus assembly protein TadG